MSNSAETSEFNQHFKAGHLAFQQGNHAQALSSFESALALQAGDVDAQRFEAHVGIVRLATQQGDNVLVNQSYAAAVRGTQAKGLERVRQVHALVTLGFCGHQRGYAGASHVGEFSPQLLARGHRGGAPLFEPVSPEHRSELELGAFAGRLLANGGGVSGA